MKSFQKIFSFVVVASLCSAAVAVADVPQNEYERGAKAIAEIVGQRNQLRLMLEGLEKELTGDQQLAEQHGIVDKVKVLIERTKAHNKLVNDIMGMVPTEVATSEGELGVQETVGAFVATYNQTIGEKDKAKRLVSAGKKKIKKLEKELKGKIAEYEALYNYFLQLVNYAEENKD